MPAPIDSATLEAERRLIASAFVDDHWLAAARRDLRPDHFAEPRHQTLWQAILDTTGEESADIADEISVTAWLTQHKRLEQITAAELNTITSLVNTPTPSTHRWQEMVLKGYKSRKIGEAAALLASKAESGAFTIEELEKEADRVAAISKPEKKRGDVGPQRFDFKAMLEFDRSNDPTCVLGNRWLCEGGSCLLVAQTGAGKSTLTTQAAMTWALDKNFFGIMSRKGPLRSLILQSENDQNDTAEMIQGSMAGLGIGNLTQTAEQIGDRVAIYREAVSTGEEFGRLLRELIIAHRAQVAFVDPILGFGGFNVSDQEKTSHFLRRILQPILTETGVVLFMVHHTNKPQPKNADTLAPTSQDMAYAGAGSAEFANWARSVMVLQKDPTPEGEQEQPHFTLRLAKRGGRSGATDSNGVFTNVIPLRHAREPGVIRWERRTATATQQPKQEDLIAERKGSSKVFSRKDRPDIATAGQNGS